MVINEGVRQSFVPYQKATLVQQPLNRVILQAKTLKLGPNLNDIEVTILELKEARLPC